MGFGADGQPTTPSGPLDESSQFFIRIEVCLFAVA